ncbi:MAG: efflux RND transporter periplasmic adaptor subunit [Burkholderiaceae bacterium]|nr:efflux RND transporter periplasmic adaptor subunit [Burkholderiaceae bacterium]
MIGIQQRARAGAYRPPAGGRRLFGVFRVTVAAVAMLVAGAVTMPRDVGALANPTEGTMGPSVETVAVSRGVLADSREWNGTLQAIRHATVAAQTVARIISLDVEAGQRVKKGQRIAVLDARETRAGIAQASAQAAQAKASLANARASYERSKSLHQQGFISQAALDAALAQLRVAQAAASQAGASVQMQQVTGSYTTIVAPYDAVISARLAEVGELAAPGRAIVSLYAPGQLRAAFFVPAATAVQLANGGRARVQITDADGQSEWTDALPVQVIPAADPSSATVEVRVDLPKAVGLRMLPGQAVVVHTERPDPDGRLSIPAAAVLQRGEMRVAYVALEGRFVLRALRLGRHIGDRVEVRAGLREGERVALDPVRAGLGGARPEAAK